MFCISLVFFQKKTKQNKKKKKKTTTTIKTLKKYFLGCTCLFLNLMLF